MQNYPAVRSQARYSLVSHSQDNVCDARITAGRALAIQSGRHADFTVTAASCSSAPSIVTSAPREPVSPASGYNEPFVVDGLPVRIVASRSVQRDLLPSIDIHLDRSLAGLTV